MVRLRTFPGHRPNELCTRLQRFRKPPPSRSPPAGKRSAPRSAARAVHLPRLPPFQRLPMALPRLRKILPHDLPPRRAHQSAQTLPAQARRRRRHPENENQRHIRVLQMSSPPLFHNAVQKHMEPTHQLHDHRLTVWPRSAAPDWFTPSARTPSLRVPTCHRRNAVRK